MLAYSEPVFHSNELCPQDLKRQYLTQTVGEPSNAKENDTPSKIEVNSRVQKAVPEILPNARLRF